MAQSIWKMMENKCWKCLTSVIFFYELCLLNAITFIYNCIHSISFYILTLGHIIGRTLGVSEPAADHFTFRDLA